MPWIFQEKTFVIQPKGSLKLIFAKLKGYTLTWKVQNSKVTLVFNKSDEVNIEPESDVSPGMAVSQGTVYFRTGSTEDASSITLSNTSDDEVTVRIQTFRNA